MTEPVQSPEDAAAARAAEQARLRKERREAKIRAGGAARLNKITGLGGGVQRDPPPPQSSSPPPSQPSATPATSAAAAPNHEDPEEVDISKHYYEPRATARQPADGSADPLANISEAQLRQMMLGFENPGAAAAANPFLGAGGAGPRPQPQQQIPGMEGMEGMEEDPMMKMLSQMMSGGGGGGIPGIGGPGGPGGANPFAGTGMESLLAGLGGGGGAGGMPGMAGMPGMQQAQKTATDKTANLWRILHAIFAVGLGLYVALTTTFTGTKTERDDAAIASSNSGEQEQEQQGEIERTRAYFFYLFTSVEAVLLTTRYFLDQSRAPPTGILWSVSGFLPAPFQAYLKHGLRYFQIFSTVRGDALVCVFVLGVCCWLRS